MVKWGRIGISSRGRSPSHRGAVGGAVAVLLVSSVVLSCAAPPPTAEVRSTVGPIPAAPPAKHPAPPPPPPEKVWAHSFATTFSPAWTAGRANPSQTIVVPVVGEEAPSTLEVALGCSIMSWNAAGTMRFTVEVSGYPMPETGSLAGGALEVTLTPKQHSLSTDLVLSTQIPVPRGVTPLGVRVTRDAAKDTLNQDPSVRVLRVSY